MAEPNFTIEEYNQLNKAMAQGALTVEYGDKKVTYRSLDDMLRIKAAMAAELGLGNAGGNRRIGQFSKDWTQQ
ncbi:MAG: hypothetical protein QM642_01885 [Edaphocola sp.]